MNNFFQAALLIFLFSILIVLYYVAKSIIRNNQKRKLEAVLKKRYLIDEKEYLRNYLSFYLPLLTNNDIQWITIWSKQNHSSKTEIKYNSLKSMVQIDINKHYYCEKHKDELKELGISQIENNYNKIKLAMIPNAKIITDVLYYIFVSIYRLNHYLNFRISISSL